MKLLAGELAALCAARARKRAICSIGYFAQHQLEQLAAADSPLTNLRTVGGAQRAARATEQELRDYLAGFGFRGDRVFEPVGAVLRRREGAPGARAGRVSAAESHAAR